VAPKVSTVPPAWMPIAVRLADDGTDDAPILCDLSAQFLVPQMLMTNERKYRVRSTPMAMLYRLVSLSNAWLVLWRHSSVMS
jgi:hypothetical protein